MREFGSKQNWLKLDDAQRGVNLVSCLDLIQSVLKEGEDLKTFASSKLVLMMLSSSSKLMKYIRFPSGISSVHALLNII